MVKTSAGTVRNCHNPYLKEGDLRRMQELRHSMRTTWPGFYAWAIPILEGAWQAEEAACRTEALGQAPSAENPWRQR